MVGDDDSGPEDALDDLDLECALLKVLIKSALSVTKSPPCDKICFLDGSTPTTSQFSA